MAAPSSHQASNSVSEMSASPRSSSKTHPSISQSSSVQVIEKAAFVEAVIAKAEGQKPPPMADRPGGGRPAGQRRLSGSSSSARPLISPKKEGAGNRQETPPRRPTTGLLSPRKAIGKRLVPSRSGTKVVPIEMLPLETPPLSPTYTPGSPSPPRRSGPGMGKGFFSPTGMRRRRSPPPIRGPPGQMEWSEEEKEREKEREVELLSQKLDELHLRLNNMDERVAETVMGQMETDDKVEVIRKAVTSKVKRLAKATGNEHLYRAPE